MSALPHPTVDRPVSGHSDEESHSGPCQVDLYWIPVGAGTSRFQRASLRAWEAFEAARARRPRTTLFHSALKLRFHDGRTCTIELTPAFVRGSVPPLAAGPVGFRRAGRFRLFRYQLQCLPVESLPDEQWAVASPVHLSDDCELVSRVLALAPAIPAHVWGRRVAGTHEIWTSDSAVSWLLAVAGVDLANVQPPAGGRAPGWQAGLTLARHT